MNLVHEYESSREFEYTDSARGGQEKLRSKRRLSHARVARPASHNGIHRRRNKRFSW
jgi:hypothetical protein